MRIVYKLERRIESFCCYGSYRFALHMPFGVILSMDIKITARSKVIRIIQLFDEQRACHSFRNGGTPKILDPKLRVRESNID